MTLLLSDGFDQYTVAADLAARWIPGSQTLYAASGGRFGGGSMYIIDDDIPAQFIMPVHGDAAASPIHAAFWFKYVAGTAQDDTVLMFLGATGNGWVKHSASGQLFFSNFGSSSTMATSPTVMVAGQWYHVEMAIKYANAGTIKMWIDGVLDVDWSGDNYSSGTPEDISSFRFYGKRYQDAYFDDIVVWDEVGTDFVLAQMGEHKIETLVPNGDSAVQFTPLSGTNFSNVDETGIDDGDTTYVESSTVGHIDLLDCTNQAAVPVTTHAIAVHTRARKTDAGAVTMRNVLEFSGTSLEGMDHAITPGYVDYMDLYGKNPNTSAAWGNTDVNSITFGYKYEA